jgi:4-amino-4-deoxy-L-arabinose transferase-like glycosyltransferase
MNIRRLAIDLALLAALAGVLFGLVRWRRAQFAGYGLAATTFDSTTFNGNVLRTSVDQAVDFSDRFDPHFNRQNFSVEWRGSIVLPRAGRYAFAIESDDGSWIDLDGRNIINNGGVHTKARQETVQVLAAGPHAIRIRYFQSTLGASVRVFWEPAGRRGGFEPIPPTILFPVPPDEVDARRAHAIPPRDLTVVILGSLAILAAALLLGRRSLRAWLAALAGPSGRVARRDLLLLGAVFALALSVRLYDLSAAGQTWDEDVYYGAGRCYIEGLLGLDFRASTYAANFEHPAAAKWLYGPATLISDSFDPPRALAAVVSALTCAFLFLAGRDLVSRRVGLLGALLAVVTPHLIAHGKVIGLESPTGLFYTLAVWLFFRGTRRGESNTGLHLAAMSFAGLAIATRILNLSVLIPIALCYVVACRGTLWRERRFPVPITLGLAPILIVVAFFGLWPYLWGDTAAHLGETLTHWKPDPNLEFWLGRKQEATWAYFPTYLAVTTPAPALLLSLAGLLALAVRPSLGHLTLLAWVVAPFLVALSPLARDGVRYLYPALFPACLLAALGLDGIVALLARLLRRASSPVRLPALALLGAALVVYVALRALSIHPYYLDYYNELVGGTRTVAKRNLFEFAWWGEGLEDAVSYINRRAPRGAKVRVWANPRHIIHLRPDIVWTESLAVDYILYNSLFNDPIRAPDFRPVYSARAAGMPLATVYERDDR